MKRCEILQFRKSVCIIEEDSIIERSLKASAIHRLNIPKYDSFLIPTFAIDIENNHSIIISNEANACDFLKFLNNTSSGIQGGLANKLTSIGYLLSATRYESDPCIILAYNYNDTAGRNGKSVVLGAISQLKKCLIYDGTDKALIKRDHEFASNKIIKRLEPEFPTFIAIDDTPKTLNMSTVKLLAGHFVDIPVFVTSQCQKLNINDPDIGLMPFSNFYNPEHKPLHDFGSTFFTEWDADQWNLFYNLMAHCIRLYLKHGIIKTINHA